MNLPGLSLPPDLWSFVQSRLSSGEYRSEGEVIHDALRLMRERGREQDARRDSLRKDIAVGLAQLDRGQGAAFDIESIKDEVRRAMTGNASER